jgi:1,4-dihydroxy-6-naphthoate synthase
MNLTLAYSPCPNDTFLFDAAVHGRIDTEGLAFDVHLADIKELNTLARTGAVQVCKVSYFAYSLLRPHYTLLEAGSALGQNCGPLLISKRPLTKEDLPGCTIAIPGADTTAHLLLQFYAPNATRRQVMLFHEIMPAVASGAVDAGVIIHESRFVYPNYGLQLVQDLGQYWEDQTGLPIPLGGIVAKSELGAETIGKLNRVIRRSVEYAFANPATVMPYVRAHAQEMDEAVMRAHIDLYVNQFSVDLGPHGHAAIGKLLQTAATMQHLV